MNLGLALLIIFLVLIFRGSIKRYAKKKKLEMKPVSYRKYNPLVHLTEVVHYETLPAFGLASKIIKANFSHVANEMLKGNEQKIIGIDDLPIVYATALPVSYPHYELFRLFFDNLTTKNITSKNTLADTLKSIEFGV